MAASGVPAIVAAVALGTDEPVHHGTTALLPHSTTSSSTKHAWWQKHDWECTCSVVTGLISFHASATITITQTVKQVSNEHAVLRGQGGKRWAVKNTSNK